MPDNTLKFSDMPYERPDLEGLKDLYRDHIRRLKEARTYEEARAVFLSSEEEERRVGTQSSLANIRHDIDTRDAFYDGEVAFWDGAYPELAEFGQQWNLALLESPFRPQFEVEFGRLMFLNTEIALRTFSPENVPLMKRENELTTEYAKLLASAQIEFEGKTYTHSQMTPFKTDPDDARRLAAWKAQGRWFKDHQADLDRIYDELVKLRDRMGKNLGYENYIPLGYDRMGRNCYHKEDVERFRKAVQKYLVPVADKIYRRQAQRLGVPYPLSYADEALSFRSGNPKPQGTAEDILAAGKKFYSELSPETKEFFDTMLDRELMDVLSTEGKAGGGYCTDLGEYKVPFIFANFNGTEGDVTVVTHEAGHAFAFWMNRDRVPASCAWPSMEACEVHSMSMEFMAWPWAEDFFGEDARKFRYSHLADAITFIPYGTMVDHFQHEVYEHPEMTPAQRHETWKRLIGIYQPWLSLDGDIPFYADGEGWQRQSHIYESPFYYIDYCLAQTVSLEFWALLQEDRKAAWERYMAYTRQGGSRVFTELLQNAGLESPFDGATLQGVCEKAARWLEAYDLTGIR